MNSQRLCVTLSIIIFLATSSGFAQPAFPGAEGFGAVATGGRGGQVVKVTNLNASGTGSFAWAVAQTGPRIVVFDVSGVINGDVEIPHGDLTIAGQTAPGAGITLHGHLSTPFGSEFGNIIIRHLRVRAPLADANWPPTQHDAIQISTNHTLMLDHIDASHGIDETIDMWGGAQDITIQYSAITFPVMGGGHPDGDEHNFGFINGPGGGRISIHHNLFVHNKRRTPAIADGPADVVNNVIYNGREGFVHNNPATGDFNLVGNIYIDGPAASLAPFWFDPENGPVVPSRYYVFDNYVDDPGTFVGRVDNPYTTTGFSAEYTFACCGIQQSQFNAVGLFDFTSGNPGYVPVTSQPALDAYSRVLQQAGAWPRDVVNSLAVAETRSRTGTWGDRRPTDWLEGLTAGTPPADGDGDGMPDDWETDNGLNPGNGTDHSTVMPSGYTAIEQYINALADSLVPLFADGLETADTSVWSATN